jgi:hypothetical protein
METAMSWRKRTMLVLTAAALLLPAACAPIAWQPLPGEPPQAVSVDDAACRLTARQLEGPVQRGLVWIAIQSAAAQQDYADCMRAHGYVPLGQAH